MDVEALRGQLGLNDVITIGVVGSINLSKRHDFCYGWEVVEALRLLKGLPVKGVIIGVGDGVRYLKELSQSYGVDDQLLFTGWIDHNRLPEYINLIDVCVSTQSNDLVGEVRITAKVPEYLACGRYIVATAVGGAKTFVKDAGLLVPCTGVKDLRYVATLADHVRAIISNRDILKKGMNGVEVAKRWFDYSVLRPQMTMIIDSLLTRTRRLL
jgi:glycosyltransferase involved in cell wall biosynthesis